MKTYKIALEEFENENEDGKIKLVYAYFGLAIYFSNCLEETLSQMIWLYKTFNSKTKITSIGEIIDSVENSKKTLGNLLNEIYTFYEVKIEHKEELNKILKSRNYLIHKYFRDHNEKFYSELGMKEMIETFSDFKDDAKKIDEKMTKYFLHYKLKLGFDDKKITELMEEMKQKEIEREKNNYR